MLSKCHSLRVRAAIHNGGDEMCPINENCCFAALGSYCSIIYALTYSNELVGNMRSNTDAHLCTHSHIHTRWGQTRCHKNDTHAWFTLFLLVFVRIIYFLNRRSTSYEIVHWQLIFYVWKTYAFLDRTFLPFLALYDWLIVVSPHVQEANIGGWCNCVIFVCIFVCTCVWVCVGVCACVCVCVCLCGCVGDVSVSDMFFFFRMCTCVRMRVRFIMWVCAALSLCPSACVRVCVCVCVWACVCQLHTTRFGFLRFNTIFM